MPLKELSPLDGAVCVGLDPLSQGRGWFRAMFDDLDHPLLRNPAKFKGSFRCIARKAGAKVHAHKVNPGWTAVNPCPRLQEVQLSHTDGMEDRWPQRSDARIRQIILPKFELGG